MRNKIYYLTAFLFFISLFIFPHFNFGKSMYELGKFDLVFFQGKSFYQVKDKSYGFARTESDLKELLKASRENDIDKINMMIISGRIKTFPSGKQIVLVHQGISTIKIKDPDTGIEYYGVSESIK